MKRNADRIPAEADPDETLGPVLDFMRLLWAIDHGLLQLSRQMEKTVGVTGPQRLVLRIVGGRPGITPTSLARTMHLHGGTLTGIVQRLEGKGLLERAADPDDGRRWRLRLTRAGMQIDAQRGGTVEAHVRSALRAVPHSDVEAARRVLSRIAGALDVSNPS